MAAPPSETDFGSAPGARIGRAVGLMAVSLLAVTATGIAYLHPGFFTTSPNALNAAAAHDAYHVVAVDFVTPTTGWVVADFESADRAAVLRTTDGGVSWTEQLAVPTNGGAQYLKFFDIASGVFALLGTRPLLYTTGDGGRTWTSMTVLSKWATALSWSFVDVDHGWILADTGRSSAASLYSTNDGGWSWQDLGPPVTPPDQVFSAQFSFLTTGWLATSSATPYAYKTRDFGATWQRVAMPSPAGAEPGGRYFVDVQQTAGRGAIASVVYFPPFNMRTSNSGSIRQFPPLPVPFYDGSRPNDYVYSTMIDQVVGAPFSAMQAPLAELLSSVDGGATWVPVKTPLISGTLGYADPTNWFWIDRGSWSSSTDAGATWTRPLGNGLIAPLPGSLRVVDLSHAWFAGIAQPALEVTTDGGPHWLLIPLPARIPPA